jgi:membrane-bound lytic murein transglycosylase D
MRTRFFLLAPIPFLFVVMREAEGRVAASPEPSETAPPAAVAALPLHLNERVERWMERFRGDQWESFKTLLERKGAYEGLIVGELRDRGMPEELLYLAMMEGGFSPQAVSSASAVGLWQFMGPTAKQYGLRIDEWVDERRDPVRATEAALDYLAWLHGRYESWYLAAAAYNAGPTRVDRILRRHAGGQTGDESLYWEVLDYLPYETRHYVPKIVAATLIGEAVERGALEITVADPYRYDTVFVPGGTALNRIASAIGVEPQALAMLNPHLVRDMTPPGEAGAVRVPLGTTPAVVASLAPTTEVLD